MKRRWLFVELLIPSAARSDEKQKSALTSDDEEEIEEEEENQVLVDEEIGKDGEGWNEEEKGICNNHFLFFYHRQDITLWIALHLI